MKRQLVYIFVFATIIVTVLIGATYVSYPDGYLRVVFCDVGQGDAIYIKSPKGKDMLIDGGPNNDVLACLGSHMAFWDRTIELLVLTHPQYDHYKGLLEVVKRYDVELLILPPVDNDAVSYQELKKIVREKNIAYRNVYVGDRVRIDDEAQSAVEFTIMWPDYQWVSELSEFSKIQNEMLTKKVLGVTTTNINLNDFSIVGNLNYKLFDVLLTGDAESSILESIFANRSKVSNNIEILKIGHHGAKAGLSKKVAEYIQPSLGIISVGKNNRYRHPRDEVLAILDETGIPYKRTDLDGEIEIVSDGQRWWVK